MEIIILGLLMIKSSTLYEIRQMIRNLLSGVSSDSTGSMQVALKKLLEKDFITFTQKVENGLNKKTYFITESGKKHFLVSIVKPMKNNSKNMELGKLFFMGFAQKEVREDLLESYITELQGDLDFLKGIAGQLEPRYAFDPAYQEELQKLGGALEFLTEEARKEIATFQYATLDYHMAALEFEIQWFEKFRKSL